LGARAGPSGRRPIFGSAPDRAGDRLAAGPPSPGRATPAHLRAAIPSV